MHIVTGLNIDKLEERVYCRVGKIEMNSIKS